MKKMYIKGKITHKSWNAILPTRRKLSGNFGWIALFSFRKEEASLVISE